MKQGFALVTKDDRFLYFEQETDVDVLAYSSKYPTDAHLFETKDEAMQVAYNINCVGALDWNYRCAEHNTPCKVVKVTITWNVDTVEKLIAD